ncbi:MAG: hypothetical protein V3V99_03100 [candidate division Zixibacteria bacterium]
MKAPFPHDVRAVFTAGAKGLALKKIFAGTFYLLIGYILYTAFTYLALLYDSVSFEYIWQSYGAFPFRIYPFDTVIGSIIQAFGLVFAALALSSGIMAGAVINFEEIRGNYFFSAFNAIKFTFSRIPTMILGYVSVAAFVGFIYLLGLLIGLISRVPFIGEVLVGLFYLVPVFVTLVFVVFIIFAVCVSVFLFPVTIAAGKEKELFGPLLQMFSVLIKEPLRFFWYLALTLIQAKLFSFILAYVFFRTIQLSRLILYTGGGEKISRMFASAVNSLPTDSTLAKFVFNIFPGVDFGFGFSRWSQAGDPSLGTILLAISFFILFVLILGYALSIISSGLARGYVVIRRMKDDYFITEEDPLNNSNGYANPPINEDAE